MNPVGDGEVGGGWLAAGLSSALSAASAASNSVVSGLQREDSLTFKGKMSERLQSMASGLTSKLKPAKSQRELASMVGGK